jgi:crotonobetainyl-CoA:carnitine CoA-transferase CaiB-like acyl-CoA transferase
MENADTTTLPESDALSARRRWQDRVVDQRARAWAASGAMMLTGRREGSPLGSPSALIALVEQAAVVVHRRSGGRVVVDGLALLGERAALSGLTRQGTTSCGGSTRLVRSADGWVGVALARPDDVAALPAWLGRDVPADDPWPAVFEAAGTMSTRDLDDRAALLSLPFAGLGSVPPSADGAFDLPVNSLCVAGPSVPGRRVPGRRVPGSGVPVPIAESRVIDLSSLWAGPLCGQLLGACGAEVIKVESTLRPDGARRGPASFFDLLNGRKRSVALDLSTAAGRRDLCLLIAASDVVIESTRPRALEQMGIVAADLLGQPTGPRVWASITSHGRSPGRRERVAFGDCAAVAGGLIAGDESGPCFLADAVADPLSGLITAAAVLEALCAGGRWLIDAAMAPMAARASGPLLDVRGEPAELPLARDIPQSAPEFGSDTEAVLRELSR